MARVAFACRSIDPTCEWALQADSPEGILRRVVEHQKCAHHVPEMSDALRNRVSASIRTI